MQLLPQGPVWQGAQQGTLINLERLATTGSHYGPPAATNGGGCYWRWKQIGGPEIDSLERKVRNAPGGCSILPSRLLPVPPSRLIPCDNAILRANRLRTNNTAGICAAEHPLCTRWSPDAAPSLGMQNQALLHTSVSILH